MSRIFLIHFLLLLQRKDTSKDLEAIAVVAANAAVKKLAESFGGTLEVISYRGGWFLYEAVGVWVPVAPLSSTPPQFHKNGEVCGVVIKSCH